MFSATCDVTETLNQQLENRVADHLSECHSSDLRRLWIVADGGTVTLRGDIDRLVTARAIAAIVRRVPGVRRVVDKMVTPPPRRADSWQTAHYQFSPALARYFEERRQGLVSDSAIVWNS